MSALDELANSRNWSILVKIDTDSGKRETLDAVWVGDVSAVDPIAASAELSSLRAENAALKEMLRECSAINEDAHYGGAGGWGFNSNIQKQIDAVLKGGTE